MMAYYIGLFESADGPRFRIVHTNGNIICTSESYSSPQARDDTVLTLACEHCFSIKDMDKNEELIVIDNKLAPAVDKENGSPPATAGEQAEVEEEVVGESPTPEVVPTEALPEDVGGEVTEPAEEPPLTTPSAD